MISIRMILTILVLATASGCSQPAAQGSDSTLAAHRIQAVSRSNDGPDSRLKLLRRLIEQLDSPDSGVRWAAIEQLEVETGETFGYRYDDPSPLRVRSIERWTEWFRTSAGSE